MRKIDINKRFFINPIIFSLLVCSCKPIAMDVEAFFVVKNDGDNKVSYVIGESYPDTSLPNGRIITLSPGDYKRQGVNENSMEDFFLSLERDTLSVFFIDYDTLTIYGIETIRDEYNILTRKEVSIGDLKNNNNTIIYH